MNIFIKLNKDIELFEKKLRGEKKDDFDVNNNKKYNDFFNLLNKNTKNQRKISIKTNKIIFLKLVQIKS